MPHSSCQVPQKFSLSSQANCCFFALAFGLIFSLFVSTKSFADGDIFDGYIQIGGTWYNIGGVNDGRNNPAGSANAAVRTLLNNASFGTQTFGSFNITGFQNYGWTNFSSGVSGGGANYRIWRNGESEPSTWTNFWNDTTVNYYSGGDYEFSVTGQSVAIIGATFINGDTYNIKIQSYVDQTGVGAGSKFYERTGNFTVNGARQLYNSSSSANQAAVYNTSSSGGVVKQGSGTLTLIFDNSNASTGQKGDIFIDEGTLAVNPNSGVSGDAALGGSSTVVRLGATGGSTTSTFALSDGDGGLSISRNIVVRAGSSGTKTISATNNSGTNTIAGSVYLDADLSTTVTSGGTLDFSGSEIDLKSQTITISGSGNTSITATVRNTTGSGNLVKNGSGTLTLGGSSANTYNGTTTLNSGTTILNKTAGTNALSGAVTINSGAILQTNSANQIGNNFVTVNTAGTFNLNNNSQILALAGSGNVTLGSATLTISNTFSDTFSGNISGSGNVVKSGTGAQFLNSANSYTGTTTVSAGTLEIQNASALGTSAAGATVSTGAVLKLWNASGMTIANEALSLNGTGVGGVGGALLNTGGNNAWTGDVTLAGNARINAETAGSLTVSGSVSGGANVLFVGASGANITLSGAISGSGGSQSGTTTSIFKDGASTLNLTAANSYTGDTRVTAGTLNVSGSGNLGSGSDVFISSGAQLNLNTSVTVASIQETGNLNGGTVSLGSGVTLTVNGANLGNFYQNSISGSGGLTMSGSGNTTLNLYGTQSYTGTTSVTSGEIITTVAMASTAYAISGGRFSTGTNSLITNNASVTLSGTGIFALGGNETLGSIAGTGGTLAINGFQLTTDSNADATFAGAITGASSRIVKKGTGTLSLTGSSNAGGGLFIDNGVVNLNGATIGFSGIDIGAGLAGDQSANNATLRVTSASTYSQNIVVNSEGTTTGTRTIDFANSSGTATLSGSVNLEKAAIVSVATNGTGVLSGQLSGVGGVTKTGAGILTLSGNNSAYSATATVSAGTLLLNHSFGGAVSVASNANLGGSMSSGQSVSGLVTLNSNSGLAPGNGSAGNIATMNFSNGLTLNSSSTVTMDLTTSASSADRINVSGGQLTYAGNLVFNAVASMSGVTNNTYTLFSTSGPAPTGIWTSVALASGPSPGFTTLDNNIWTRNAGDGNVWTYNQSAGTLNVIPEPSTYALMGVGAAFLLWRIRRRKRD